MSSRLQLDVRNLSLGMRHLVNAYEVEAGTVYFACNTVWSVPERLQCEVRQYNNHEMNWAERECECCVHNDAKITTTRQRSSVGKTRPSHAINIDSFICDLNN